MAFVTNDGVRISFSVQGNSKAVLLVPGLGGSIRQLARISTELARGHKVISIDPRGAGDSDKPNGPYGAADRIGDVIAVRCRDGVVCDVMVVPNTRVPIRV